ncbi:MAG: Crp/Fnr family transcriptional regulator, partial [Rhodanobacteraceae bacterium]
MPRAEVTRLAGLRRSAILFSRAQPADCLYFVESGLVKLTRTNDEGGRIILEIRGPGEVMGEESLAADQPAYYADAEVLNTAAIARIPKDLFARAMVTQSDLARAFIACLLDRRRALAEKVELLCLHGVEYRILVCLAELSSLVKESTDGGGYQLPLTQLELADLVGATRETTSTTLNQLERRGLIRLSRRLVTVPSPALLRDAAVGKLAPNNEA